ncbi:MAG: TetR/AcrR family transcriptional regulator [bacterium]
MASSLFMEHGYAAVSLSRIAQAVGLRTPSLYAHFPGGKEQLYVEASERALDRYRRGIECALGSSLDLRQALRAAAYWLLSQPPMNLARMVRTDLTRLSPSHQRRLAARAFECLIQPLLRWAEDAAERGQVGAEHVPFLGPVFLVATEGLPDAARYSGLPAERLAEGVVDLLLDGARQRR